MFHQCQLNQSNPLLSKIKKKYPIKTICVSTLKRQNQQPNHTTPIDFLPIVSDLQKGHPFNTFLCTLIATPWTPISDIIIYLFKTTLSRV